MHDAGITFNTHLSALFKNKMSKVSTPWQHMRCFECL